MSYFHKAVEFYARKTRQLHVLVCCENDECREWCQKHFVGMPATFHYSRSKSAIVDLALMSMCGDVIQTTGTYSWWGAWLANGTSVYYSNYPAKNSPLADPKRFSKEDHFFPGWIPMDDS
jgi:galactoside 2-L-fucosyltransferase 1/2